jgi:hypothetical protein
MEAGGVGPVGKVENIDNPLTVYRLSPARPERRLRSRAPVNCGDAGPSALKPLRFGARRRGEAGAPAVTSHIPRLPRMKRRPGA